MPILNRPRFEVLQTWGYMGVTVQSGTQPHVSAHVYDTWGDRITAVYRSDDLWYDGRADVIRQAEQHCAELEAQYG